MMKLTLFFPILAMFLFPTSASSKCDCGYLLTDNGAYFIHRISHTFAHYPPATGLNTNNAASKFSKDWIVQGWSASATGIGGGGRGIGLLPRQHDKSNVFIEDGMLILRQRGYSDDEWRRGANVSVAGIASREEEILHGSFRVTMSVGFDRVFGDGALSRRTEKRGGGSVGGFFYYHASPSQHFWIRTLPDICLMPALDAH